MFADGVRGNSGQEPAEDCALSADAGTRSSIVKKHLTNVVVTGHSNLFPSFQSGQLGGKILIL